MTLVVRDEEDIVDEVLRYHFSRGVDFVIATDHRSVDGTTDILRTYERDGRLHLIREQRELIRQEEAATHMARLACTDFAADWVINCDADEFWWPRDGSLPEVLDSVPDRFGLVYGAWRQFVLRPDSEEPFYDRMLVRRTPVWWESAYFAHVKAAHRAVPDVRVGPGNHTAAGRGLVPLRNWFAFEVFHFPIRSAPQLERKYLRRFAAPRSPSRIAAGKGVRERGAEAVARDYLVDDELLSAGLADGTLVLDVRLRDALRDPTRPLAHLTLEDDIALAMEYSPHHVRFAVYRGADSADRLEPRVAALESRRVFKRVARRLSTAVTRGRLGRES